MAKLSVFLCVFLLLFVVLIFACVEGYGSSRGKNKPRNRQKDRPQKIREEIVRKNEKLALGEKFQYDLPFILFEDSEFDVINYIKSRLWYGFNVRHYGLYDPPYSKPRPDPWMEGPPYSKSRPDPWMEGPNVCKKETVDNFAATHKDSRNYVRFNDSGTRTCEEYKTMIKCTLVIPAVSPEESERMKKRNLRVVTSEKRIPAASSEKSGPIKWNFIVVSKTYEIYKGINVPTGRTFTLLYECCHGYDRDVNDYGCPIKIANLDLDLTEKAEKLGLTDFLKAVKMLKIASELQSKHFTLFVPQNGAYSLDSDLIDKEAGLIFKMEPTVIEVSDRAVDKGLKSFQNVFRSHMVPGIKSISLTEDEELLQTAGPNGTTIRINHFYKPKKLMTANCVPITRSEIATNGYINVVDKVLKPVTQSLMEIINSRPELSLLKRILASPNYTEKFDQEGHMTLLAPTNSAFEKLPPYLKYALLEGDDNYINKFILHHLLSNVLCAEAIKGKVKTMNSLNNYIIVTRTKDNKIFFNDAQVVQSDVMGTNGVIHIIDKALVPDQVLEFAQVLKKEGLTEFLSLIKNVDLLNKIEKKRNITVLVPTNKAIQHLNSVIFNKWKQNPIMDIRAYKRAVIDFHVSPTSWHITNNVTQTTLANKMIRIRTSQQVSWRHSLFPDNSELYTKTVQCVPFVKMDIEYFGGLIHVIKDEMIPPDGNVMDVLSQNKDYCKFVSLIKRTSLVNLLQGEGPITVFAPNNRAFNDFDERVLKEYYLDNENLENFIKHHIKQDIVCSFEILLTPVTGDEWHRSSEGILKLSRFIVSPRDNLATNGNVIELDKVLLEEPFFCGDDCDTFYDCDQDDWDLFDSC